jgi:hypothetical protein
MPKICYFNLAVTGVRWCYKESKEYFPSFGSFRARPILENLVFGFVLIIYYTFAREKLLVSHRAPPQVADRGTLTKYFGYRGNKIPGVVQK